MVNCFIIDNDEDSIMDRFGEVYPNLEEICKLLNLFFETSENLKEENEKLKEQLERLVKP